VEGRLVNRDATLDTIVALLIGIVIGVVVVLAAADIAIEDLQRAQSTEER